jgi:undecaprenyl-diphosphatase
MFTSNNRSKTPSPSKRRLRFQLSIGILVGVFAILTALVVVFPSFAIDLKITLALQSIHNPFFTWLMETVSWAGFLPQSVFITVILIFTVFVIGYRWESVVLVFLASSEALLNLLIKIIIQRPRPGIDLVDVDKVFNSASFPSGHVMFYMAFFGFLCFLIFTLIKPLWLRTILLFFFGGHILLVGLSRVYLGEHWASDALGAYLIGSVILIVFIRIYRWGKPRYFVRSTTFQ